MIKEEKVKELREELKRKIESEPSLRLRSELRKQLEIVEYILDEDDK